MKSKNDVEVLINGKKYTLSGYESEEYMQKIANYINSKYSELRSKDYYGGLDLDLRTVLLQINLADDYYKAQKRAAELDNEAELKDKMVFDIKHELINAQTKLEESEKQYKELTKKFDDAQKEIVRLQTQLKTTRTNR